MIEQLHAPGVEQGQCIAIDFAALLFRQYVLQRHEWFTHEFTAPSIANDLVNTVGAEHGGEIATTDFGEKPGRTSRTQSSTMTPFESRCAIAIVMLSSPLPPAGSTKPTYVTPGTGANSRRPLTI
jgi:hypothetical protein